MKTATGGQKPEGGTQAADVVYTVFAPMRALSRTRWQYYQGTNGDAWRTISGPTFGEGSPWELTLSEVLPDAWAWAHLMHDGPPRFPNSPEADEVYATLCNVAMHAERGDAIAQRLCLEGIISDCQEWLRRLREKE